MNQSKNEWTDCRPALMKRCWMVSLVLSSTHRRKRAHTDVKKEDVKKKKKKRRRFLPNRKVSNKRRQRRTMRINLENLVRRVTRIATYHSKDEILSPFLLLLLLPPPSFSFLNQAQFNCALFGTKSKARAVNSL